MFHFTDIFSYTASYSDDHHIVIYSAFAYFHAYTVYMYYFLNPVETGDCHDNGYTIVYS